MTGGKLLVAVVGAVFAGGPAFSSLAFAQGAAAPAGFDVQLFRPAAHAEAMFSVESAQIAPSPTLNAGLYFDYAYKPLQLYTKSSNQTLAGLVNHRLDAQVFASVTVFDRLSLAFGLPVSLFQSGNLTLVPDAPRATLTPAALGDLTLSPKIGLLEQARHYVNVALKAQISVPTAALSARGKGSFHGDGTITAAVELDLSRRIHLFRIALNAGFLWRQQAQLYDLVIGPELYYRAGVGFDLGVLTARVPLEIVGEVFGRTSAQSAFQSEAQSPLEWLAGVKYTPARFVQLSAGAGRGIVPGYGAPAARAFLGVAFTPIVPSPPTPPPTASAPVSIGLARPSVVVVTVLDSDGDGIPDNADRCPNAAEDKDGFEDDDGCPDLDNDKDGVPDAQDRCPMVAGSKDNAGCPEQDSDGDGIPNRLNRCPADAEDKDGFQDDDGCPDLDNDGDGIPDSVDKCPNEPETINGVDDYDGCPDKGQSLVVITASQIEIKDKVYFKTGKAELDQRSNNLLDQVAAVIKNHVGIKRVRIEGHTDEVGGPDKNQKLSQARAESVRDYLVKKGVSPARLLPVGYGEKKPVSTNKTLKGREQNRRVVFAIVGDEEPVPP